MSVYVCLLDVSRIVFAVDEFMKGFDSVLFVFHDRDAGTVDSVILPVTVDGNAELGDYRIGGFKVIHDAGRQNFADQLHDCAGIDVGDRIGDKV